jgi:hypothetical protein
MRAQVIRGLALVALGLGALGAQGARRRRRPVALGELGPCAAAEVTPFFFFTKCSFVY